MGLVRYPLMLQSFRAHTEFIGKICFVDEHELIVTSSSDFNIRVFSLTGQYIGIFGQPNSWQSIVVQSVNKKQALSIFFQEKFLKINFKRSKPSQMPNDLRRVASANTFRVVRGSTGSKWKLIQRTFIGVFNMCNYHFIYIFYTLFSSSTRSNY